jgi:GTPase SAR1 family protein
MPAMSHDLRFKHQLSCIIRGPNGSGKSSFCIRVLQNVDTLCTEPNFDGGILWCYGEKNAVPLQQLASIEVVGTVRYHEGMPENFLNEVGPCLI